MKQTKEQLRFKRNESGEGNDVDDTNVTESGSTAGAACEETADLTEGAASEAKQSSRQSQTHGESEESKSVGESHGGPRDEVHGGSQGLTPHGDGGGASADESHGGTVHGATAGEVCDEACDEVDGKAHGESDETESRDIIDGESRGDGAMALANPDAVIQSDGAPADGHAEEAKSTEGMVAPAEEGDTEDSAHFAHSDADDAAMAGGGESGGTADDEDEVAVADAAMPSGETAAVTARSGPVAGLRRWLEHGDARARRRRKILSAAVAAVLAVAMVWALAVVYDMFIKLPLETAQAKARQSQLLEEYGFDPGSIISDDEFFDGDALDADGVQAVLDKRGAKCQGSECLRNYTETVESIPADELCEGYPVAKTDKNYKAAASTSKSASSSSSSSKASGDAGKAGAASGNSSASKSSDTSDTSKSSNTSGTSASDSDKSSSGAGQGAQSSSQSNQSSQSSNGSAAAKQSSGQSSAQSSSSSQTAAGTSADTFTDATATHSAAEIIANAGKSCGISQKVLLVMLEKEQGLVSATKPTQDAYDAALGLSCPDGAACDAKYKGFFKQVYGAAERFRYYLTHEDEYGYYANRLNYVAFNPDESCGGRNVWIENDATALLYIYTPYQPNDAALAAGAGEGDECSAYGNRNFKLLYDGWFG